MQEFDYLYAVRFAIMKMRKFNKNYRTDTTTMVFVCQTSFASES